MRRAFTLLELLTVISIIIVLVSILIPAVNRARENARTVQCLSNMKQIGNAMKLYSDDNREAVVPMAYMLSASTVSDTWATILVGTGYVKYPAATSTQVLNTPTIFHCPSGQDDVMATLGPTNRSSSIGACGFQNISTGLQPGLVVYTWYAVNGSSYSFDPLIPCHSIPFKDAMGTQGVFSRYSQILRAADLVCLYDGIFGDQSTENADRVNARHESHNSFASAAGSQGGSCTNLLFFDGHSETWATSQLPGGSGDAGSAPSLPATVILPSFLPSAITTKGRPFWRLDQQ